MESGSCDISMNGIWQAWQGFRRGKKISYEIIIFESHLLDNLFDLQRDLITGKYVHEGYRHVQITEKKRRDLAIASIRDRVVHRLLYDFLVLNFDKQLIFDVWSCRKGKGLIVCIERTKKLLYKDQNGFFWRCDIEKFFDHVRHDVLILSVFRRITDSNARWLLKEVIDSYQSEKIAGGGCY